MHRHNHTPHMHAQNTHTHTHTLPLFVLGKPGQMSKSERVKEHSVQLLFKSTVLQVSV